MTLQDIFDQLTYGELSQLSIGGSEQGAIDAANYVRILAHINLGLTTLYRRFPLKEGRLTIQLYPDTVTYPINSDYAQSNRRSDKVPKFLLDSTTAPFINDVLKIERIYTEDAYELSLNNESDLYSIFTPSAHVLRVPTALTTQEADLPAQLKTSTLEIVYRANHPIVSKSIGYLDAKRVEMELPYSHLEPLLLFIASRLHNPIGMTNEFHAGNSYAAKFEQACKQLEIDNVGIDQRKQNDRLSRGGWA